MQAAIVGGQSKAPDSRAEDIPKVAIGGVEELPIEQGRRADLHVHLHENPQLVGIWHCKGFDGPQVDCLDSRERSREDGGGGRVCRVQRGRDKDVNVAV